jgi:preflagellin peptidase FlaK
MIQTGMFSVVFCSLILLYACYSDLKTRTVANEVWLLMIAVGIPLAIYNFYVQGIPFLIRFVLSLAVTFALSYLFFYMNLFGGADAKSLISIAVLLPVNPLLSTSLIFYPLPFAVTTLFNGAIISLIVPPSLFLYNLLPLRSAGLQKDLSLAFIGYKMRIDGLAKSKHKFLRLLHSYESAEGAGKEGTVKRKFSFGGAEIDDETIEKLKNYYAQGKISEDVWVTPGLPYMLFITAGFFIALFYGNLILHILTALFPL